MLENCWASMRRCCAFPLGQTDPARSACTCKCVVQGATGFRSFRRLRNPRSWYNCAASGASTMTTTLTLPQVLSDAEFAPGVAAIVAGRMAFRSSRD